MTSNDSRQDGTREAVRSSPELGSAAGESVPRQRIAKAMARAGLCSRREAEAWVLAGRVVVNGEVLASPARDVTSADEILVDGAPMPIAEKTRLFLFHKPRGLVTSDHDPEGRETVADFLRENWPDGPRVVTVGRLDINTEGLLLLTNDGGLARTLELPETGWARRYRVRAKGQADQAQLDALADGISIEGMDYAGIEARLDRVQGSNCWLTMALREGKNREIKRILEHLGLEVNRLIRLSFGPFQLLDLPEGAVEEVRTRVLRDQLGTALAAQAGVDFGGEGDAEPRGRATTDVRPASAEPGRRPRPSTGRTADRRNADARPTHDASARPERDDRPATGARRHVSASRTLDEQRTKFGPRKRIERSDTKDRRDRTVAVERLVRSSQPSSSPRGPKRISPSAEAKRARVARSGGSPGERRRGPADDESGGGRRPPRAEGRGFRQSEHAGSRDRTEAPRSRWKERTEGGRKPGRTQENARSRREEFRGGEPRVARGGGFKRDFSDRGAAGDGNRPARGRPGRPPDAKDARKRPPRDGSAPLRRPDSSRPPRSGAPPHKPRGGGAPRRPRPDR